MIPKVASLILCYGLTDYLKPVIKQYQRLDKILVMNYLFPEADLIPDNTSTICKEMGVECISGSGLRQEEILNKGIDLLKDYPIIFISDADEFIMRKDQDELIQRQVTSPYNYVCIPMYDYAQDLFHIYKIRTHKQVVLGTPQTKFYDARCVCGAGVCYGDIYVHHLGFLFSKDKLEWKRKLEIKTHRYDVVVELMQREIENFNPPQELLDLIKEQ